MSIKTKWSGSCLWREHRVQRLSFSSMAKLSQRKRFVSHCRLCDWLTKSYVSDMIHDVCLLLSWFPIYFFWIVLHYMNISGSEVSWISCSRFKTSRLIHFNTYFQSICVWVVTELQFQARGGTPRDCVPPRPPMKSAPPVSRIHQHRPVSYAQLVSFKPNHNNNSILFMLKFHHLNFLIIVHTVFC